jgi:cytochrome c-type biogenesis protein CcmH
MSTDTPDALRARIRQIDALAADGTLSAEAAASARAELERQLVVAVMAAPAGTPAPTPQATVTPDAARPSRRLVASLVGFVLVFGAAGYAWRGHPEAWSVGPGNPATPTAAGTSHDMGDAQIQGMVKALADKLKQRPDDAEGWLMLGRSYTVLGRFDEAIPAYRTVLKLDPKNAQAMADLADALAMQQQRSFKGEPEALVAAALKADPANLKALALAGTLAFEAGDFKGAIGHWERAVQVGPADSALVQQLQGGIAEARQAAGLAPAAAPSTAQATQAPALAPAGISGRVELAPALAAKASPDDTVFIFARPAEDSRMPLALLKKRVRDLPADFSLDDSMAMTPAARLSGAARVVVGARVSKSGQAMPQPGDLEGLSEPTAPGATGLRIVIGQEVR